MAQRTRPVRASLARVPPTRRSNTVTSCSPPIARISLSRAKLTRPCWATQSIETCGSYRSVPSASLCSAYTCVASASPTASRVAPLLRLRHETVVEQRNSRSAARSSAAGLSPVAPAFLTASSTMPAAKDHTCTSRDSPPATSVPELLE
eukprot:scaffold115120_cov31-Tisochrysis_lutea.AAC.2